jgi:hypothetical protein
LFDHYQIILYKVHHHYSVHLNVIEHNNKRFVEHIYLTNVKWKNHLMMMIQIISNYEKEMQLFSTKMIIYNEVYLVINDIDDDECLINDQS